jgi:hypothetical protein
LNGRIAAIDAAGRLVVITGPPDDLNSGMSALPVRDGVGMYRRIAGPTIVSRGAGLADVVVIEDGESLTCFTPLITGSLFFAAAVGSDGSLRVVSIDPVANTIDVPVDVDASVAINTSGPVALGPDGVKRRGACHGKAGQAPGPPFACSAVEFGCPCCRIAIRPLGGVTPVTIDIGVMVIVAWRGRDCLSSDLDGRLDLVAARTPCRNTVNIQNRIGSRGSWHRRYGGLSLAQGLPLSKKVYSFPAFLCDRYGFWRF